MPVIRSERYFLGRVAGCALRGNEPCQVVLSDPQRLLAVYGDVDLGCGLDLRIQQNEEHQAKRTKEEEDNIFSGARDGCHILFTVGKKIFRTTRE